MHSYACSRICMQWVFKYAKQEIRPIKDSRKGVLIYIQISNGWFWLKKKEIIIFCLFHRLSNEEKQFLI